MDRDRLLRKQVVSLLRGGNAHMSFAEAIADFPERSINERPPHLPYSFWHLLEHLRLTQADILDYLTNASYHARSWPAEYWPSRDAEATKAEWDETIASFQRDLAAIVAIVADETNDLFGTVPSGGEHTVLREALIVADHNAYHVGELGILCQVANAWGERDAD